MDFAPYQDTSPETVRALSPPPNNPNGARRSGSFSPRVRSPAPLSPPFRGPGGGNNPWNAPISSAWNNESLDRAADVEANAGAGDVSGGGGFGGQRGHLDEFETSLPIRLDYEACLAYLLLPPAGGVLLLILERKSDYVRFHAWQSSLLFTVIFLLHLIFSWSSFLSWVIFLVDLGLIGYLTMRAYKDANTLDRCEVPFFGPLASKFLDDE